MKLEIKKITQLVLSDLYRLDPVRVALENIEPGKGRITITCYGKSWSSYWGGMGGGTVEEFFVGCTNDYLIGNLAQGLYSTRFTGDSVAAFARESICQRRRCKGNVYLDFGSLEKKEARELFESVSALHDCTGADGFWSNSTLLTEIFGSEWFHYLDGRAAEPNPDWIYLDRICNAVREGLKAYIAQKAPEGETV